MRHFDHARNLMRHGVHPEALRLREHERATLIAEAQTREFMDLSSKVVGAFFGADEVATMGGEPDNEVAGERVIASVVTHNRLRVRLTLEVE